MATNALELESASCAVNRWYVCTNLLMWSPHGMRAEAVEISTEQIRHGAFGGARRTSLVYLGTCSLACFQYPSRSKAVMPLTRTFTDQEFADQALLSGKAKLIQSASPPLQRTHLQVPENCKTTPIPTYLRLWLR